MVNNIVVVDVDARETGMRVEDDEMEVESEVVADHEVVDTVEVEAELVGKVNAMLGTMAPVGLVAAASGATEEAVKVEDAA